MNQLHVMNHPLISSKITFLRDKNTPVKEVRALVNEISLLMGYEATKDLSLTEIEVETPLVKTKGYTLKKQVVLVPILRAGLGMLNAFTELIPAAKVGYIGLARNEETLQPEEYYCKLPEDMEHRQVLLLDPMLATGGSAVAAIDAVKKRGAKRIKLICMISAPIGAETVMKAHPDVEIYTAAMDEGLNEKGYILPGLGDAGDRLFGTL